LEIQQRADGKHFPARNHERHGKLIKLRSPASGSDETADALFKDGLYPVPF
jgi:hypothetical protein